MVLTPALAGAQAAVDPAAASPSAICTDRPTKSNFACSVDAGYFQYESDLFNWSHLRADGTTTDTSLVLNPTLKYGLTSTVDLEANIAALEIVRTKDATGTERTSSGLGDLYLRLKYEFINLHGGDIQLAVLPYVKAPTAHEGIGNGAVEGGAFLPVNYKLNSVLTLTTVPEVDTYKDAAGSGYHLNTAQLVNVGTTLSSSLTLYTELWGGWNFDPGHTVRQSSADIALTYGASADTQWDVGVNFGLSAETPNVQAYVGLSQRF